MSLISFIEVNEDKSVTLMARLTQRPTAPDTPGTPLTQANFSSMTYTVTDRGASPPAAVSGHDDASLTVASVIFDTLQGWHVDTIGHNFRTTIAGTAFPTGGNKYQIEVEYTLTSGETGAAIWEATANPLYTS